ncbi:hypothetical protein RYX36_000010 [Vicia faba]
MFQIVHGPRSMRLIKARYFRDIATFNINPRVTVTIKDVISGSIRLTVHCKSKDDDLGFHTLQSGQIYRFSFKPSAIITINTLFFCSFTWPGSPYRHYLDVYDQKRNTCTNCYWLISQQGGCLNGQCRVWQRIESIDTKNSTSKMVLVDAYRGNRIAFNKGINSSTVLTVTAHL